MHVTTEAKPQEYHSSVESYLKETFRHFIGLPKKQENLVPPIPEPLKKLLLRCEEYESSHRDHLGNWEHSYADNYQRQKLWIPEVDLWVKEVKGQLHSQGIQTHAMWPNAHPFAVCLTHDVDLISEQQTITQCLRRVNRAIRSDGNEDLHWISSAARILYHITQFIVSKSKRAPDTSKSLEVPYNIEKEYSVSASYLFSMYPLTKYSQYDPVYNAKDRCRFLGKKRTVRDVMQHLLQDGHDIGLQGSYLSGVAKNLLQEQKQTLEKILQHPIYTTRQQRLHYQFPTTPQRQAGAGLEVDSTIGYNRNIGFRAGTSFPFYLFDTVKKEKLPLLEIPLIAQDFALLSKQALEYPPEQALAVVKNLINTIEEVGGCATFQFHPHTFTDPKIEELYRQIIEYALERNAWVTNLNEIRKWWNQRNLQLG